jgi:hypothetical protein
MNLFWQRLSGKQHFRQGIMAKGLFLALPIKLKKWERYLTLPESNVGKAHCFEHTDHGRGTGELNGLAERNAPVLAASFCALVRSTLH